MNISTKKWLFIKISSAILLPLLFFILLKLISVFDSDYQNLMILFTTQPFKLIFSLFLVISFFFYSLTISEIFEDYVGDIKIKNVANKVVYTFAIIFPLIIIIIIHTL